MRRRGLVARAVSHSVRVHSLNLKPSRVLGKNELSLKIQCGNASVEAFTLSQMKVDWKPWEVSSPPASHGGTLSWTPWSRRDILKWRG